MKWSLFLKSIPDFSANRGMPHQSPCRPGSGVLSGFAMIRQWIHLGNTLSGNQQDRQRTFWKTVLKAFSTHLNTSSASLFLLKPSHPLQVEFISYEEEPASAEDALNGICSTFLIASFTLSCLPLSLPPPLSILSLEYQRHPKYGKISWRQLWSHASASPLLGGEGREVCMDLSQPFFRFKQKAKATQESAWCTRHRLWCACETCTHK